MSVKITRHQNLDVYKRSFQAAMQIFKVSKQFPKEETYSLTDKIRRSSRSVCANLAEAWRKQNHEAAFINKLNDLYIESSKTKSRLVYAIQCEHLHAKAGDALF